MAEPTERHEWIKHDDAIAFDVWLASDDGQRCLAAGAIGVYLQNRLNRAFHQGVDHGRRCPKPRNGRRVKVVRVY